MSSPKKYHCFRVYASGIKSTSLDLTEQEKTEWIEYNQVFRFGCAMFVDGKCVYTGYFHKEQTLVLEHQIENGAKTLIPPPLREELQKAYNLKNKLDRLIWPLNKISIPIMKQFNPELKNI